MKLLNKYEYENDIHLRGGVWQFKKKFLQIKKCRKNILEAKGQPIKYLRPRQNKLLCRAWMTEKFMPKQLPAPSPESTGLPLDRDMVEKHQWKEIET